MVSSYIIHLAILIGIFSILAVALNLATGYTGMINLAHIAFFAIGAYTSALLTKAGHPYLLALLLAGIIPTLFAFGLVRVTKKLKSDYLLLATLGFHYVVFAVLLNWTSLTRGPLGIPGISKPSFFGMAISSNGWFLLFVASIAAISFAIIWRIVSSPFGRLLQATRDNEVGARVLGKNTFMLKAKAMMISAFFAGVAGSLFAHYITFIDPGSFALNEIILILTIVIVGGLATIKGSFIGTIVIILIPEVLRFFALPSSILGPARQILYALILLLILLYKPRGLFGRIDLI